MVEATSQKVKQITEELYQGGYIDKITVKWLSQTPNPPRVPVFFPFHKDSQIRPIAARNDGPTERISAFVDSILSSMANSQKSYLKDTTDRGHISSLSRRYQPIHKYPTRRGNNIVCRAYENFYGDNTPIPTQSLREIQTVSLQENSFEFNDKNYIQIHGTAMGTKMAVAFANIFMSSVETEIISQSESGKETLTTRRNL